MDMPAMSSQNEEPNKIKEKACEYFANGFNVIPIKGKRPLVKWEKVAA
jgi:hypothetical protein